MNSLGFNKQPKDTRVVVAMSGGVDSSVVAALLHEEGYDVIGVTLQLYDHGEAIAATSKTCCAGQDIHDARRVAEKFGFPHYVLDYESNFRETVIEDFANSYMRGETPIPCVRCNQHVKFHDLLKTAKDLGADCMATGHYIQRTEELTGASLLRGKDPTKDQSYFLFATTQEQLDFLRFPLGGWNKDKTREEALRLGLIVAEKPDSQDICFVPNGDYASVVTKVRPDAEKPGNIVDKNGNALGTHKGIIHYTVGQRRGIGIGGGVSENNEPFYVIRVDAKNNQVIVGSKDDLARNVIYIDDCNWLSEVPEGGLDIELKFRSVMKPIEANLIQRKDGKAELHLKDKQYGVSPGQAAVCYDGEILLGGGWITGSK